LLIALKVKLVFFLDSLNKKRKSLFLKTEESPESQRKLPGVKSFTSVSIIVAKAAYNVRQNLDSCLRCKKSIKFTPLKQLSHEKKDFCRN